jgi:uncharacterized protein (TIGR02300 family)
MSMKSERGTKRTCQSASCGSRFYDLNRDPISCPICGTVYDVLTATSSGAAAPAAEKAPRRAAKKPDLPIVPAPGDAPDVEADDALAEIETDDDAIDDNDDETFLEAEEEDGGDVSGIIGGPVKEGDEEP